MVFTHPAFVLELPKNRPFSAIWEHMVETLMPGKHQILCFLSPGLFESLVHSLSPVDILCFKSLVDLLPLSFLLNVPSLFNCILRLKSLAAPLLSLVFLKLFLGREESLNMVLFLHWLGFNRLSDELFYLVGHIDVSAQVNAPELLGEGDFGYYFSDDRLAEVCEVKIDPVQVLIHLKHF